MQQINSVGGREAPYQSYSTGISQAAPAVFSNCDAATDAACLLLSNTLLD